jgi:glycosyltransferase involved in cell wall biosynthesis
MDAFSAGMARRAELTPWPLKLIVRNEARRLARYEAALAPAFQALTIISEADRDQLSPAVAQRVQIVPNGVNRAFLQPPAEQPKPIDLIFTGNMSYYPNVQAAKYLVQELLPALADVSLNVFLVGTSPSSQVKALANEQVTVTGYVADLRPYLAQAKLFVAPLFSGSGLQNKLLEAMGMHVPVITTPNAHRALGGEPDKTLAVCKDKAAFVASIHRLLASPREAERMGAAGHAYVVRNYDWQVFNQQLEAIFAAAGSPHSAVAAPKVDHA